MTFGEKLVRLRKENGLSQEALAEKLDTTRQAISKWENGQGYPEIKKLLMISNLFNISVDKLLKENSEEIKANEKGCYVSREYAEGYLAYEQRIAKRVAIGISILVGAGVPYYSLKPDTYFSIILAAVIFALSIGVLVTTLFMENPYKKISKEVLLFDNSFYIELKSRYEQQKKKYIFVVNLGVVLLIISGIIYKATANTQNLTFPAKELYCALFAMGLFCIVYVIGITEPYDTLLNSNERMNKLHIRVMKKIKDKLTK